MSITLTQWTVIYNGSRLRSVIRGVTAPVIPVVGQKITAKVGHGQHINGTVTDVRMVLDYINPRTGNELHIELE